MIAIKNGESDRDPSRKRSKFLEWEVGRETFPNTLKDFMDWVTVNEVELGGKKQSTWYPLE